MTLLFRGHSQRVGVGLRLYSPQRIAESKGYPATARRLCELFEQLTGVTYDLPAAV